MEKYVLRIFACTVILVLAVGCSSSEKAVSLAMPASDSIELMSPKITKQENSEVYDIDLGDGAEPRHLFGTALRECGVKKRDSLAALTRQLFVGLEKIRISLREAVKVDGKDGFRILADADVDDSNIGIASYSFKVKDCVIDVVFWKEGSFPTATTAPNISKGHLETLVARLLKNPDGNDANS